MCGLIHNPVVWLFTCALVHGGAIESSKSSNANAAIPQSCSKQDLKILGEPKFLSPDSEVSLGLSIPQRQFRAGGDVVLHVWALNRSANTWNVMTCMDLDFFKSRAFDIYDSAGRRVYSRWEVKVREHCKTEPAAASLEWILKSCSRNFAIPIAAGTCITGEDYDFTVNLRSLYDFVPGEYVIHLRPEDARVRDICAATPERAFVPGTRRSSFHNPPPVTASVVSAIQVAIEIAFLRKCVRQFKHD